MVDNAVKESGGDFSVSEDVIPASELKVSSDDEGFSLIAL